MRVNKISSAALPLLALGLATGGVYGAADKARIAKSLARYSGIGAEGPCNDTNVYETDFPGVTWDEENWLLSSTHLEQGRFQSRGAVANGYFGINVASVGPFFEIDNVTKGGDLISGWPLFSRRQSFATVAGFFDAQPETNGSNFPWLNQYGYESVISGVPHWSGLILDLGDDMYLDSTVDNTTIKNFKTTYDFKAGVLSWSYTWAPHGHNGSYQIRYLLFANKLNINQAVVDMEIVSSVDRNATVVNVIDGYSAVRTNFVDSGEDDSAVYSAVSPHGVSNVTAYVYTNMTGSKEVDLSQRKLVKDKSYINTNDSSIAQSVPVSLSVGKAVRVTKFVGVASSDAFEDPQDVARKAVSAAHSNGFYKSLRSHVKEWATVMPDDSVDSYAHPKTGKLPKDNYIIDSAIISVANTYYLLQTTVSKNAQKLVNNAPVNVDSISVGGLASDSYAGLVFWDADLWMQPGLTTSHPEAAERITNYRLKHYGQAQANAQTSYTGSQNQTNFTSAAAIYPWTSGRYGNCTGTGPCWDYQYHLNGDIGLSLINQWVTSGDTKNFKDNLFPIYDSVATMYSELLKPNGSSWTVTNMTDPDEYANHVDAGAFTMPMIAETLDYANAFRKQFNMEQNETWNDLADNVLVLRENGVTLEFTTMNGSAVVKQADVIMVTFPLRYTTNYTAQDSLNDLDYYANSQSPDGPAMTWAFFSVIANEISPSGCSAYTYSQYSYKPYARAPFYQLSEQLIDNSTINGGTHPAYPFLTGHGGANQVGIYGYLGFRIVPDDVLHINPNLPPQIPHFKYRTFYWRGWPMSAHSNLTHTTISRAKHVESLENADGRFANKSITISVGDEKNATTYQLPINGSVTVANRNIGCINTIKGNLVQCRPATSPNSYRPGQFPIGAIDGATSTKWQPSFADNTSVLTVTLAEDDVGSMVSGFQFNWAKSPPVNATVIFHNHTLRDAGMVASSSQKNSSYNIVSQLTNVKLSDPFSAESTNLDMIAMPTGNTTNVTLSDPVPAAKYASLVIVGNQALESKDVDAKNGTGATVAEWAIIGKEREKADSESNQGKQKRQLGLRAAAQLASGKF